MREPTVVLAHSTREWAQDLHFFLMDHGGAVVRGYVVSPEDAIAEQYDALLVDDVTSFLSHRLVAALQRRGARVIGFYDGADTEGAGKARLLDLGVDEAVAADSPAAEILEIVVRLVGPVVTDDVEPASLVDAFRGRPPSVVADHDAVPHGGNRGTVVAVSAATGGSGATEIAIALAAALRDNEVSTVLVDADEQAPSIAQRLGLGLHPNIRSAVDAVLHRTTQLDATLHRLTSIGIEVLCGLPNPRDWFELRPGDVTEVLAELRTTRAQVVVNVGSRIDDLPDQGGPARFGVSRSLLVAADVIVLVGSASPLGAGRIIDWLADGRRLIAGKPLHVVINQHSGGAFAAGELEAEVRKAVSPRSVTMVPHDRRVARAAWSGDPVPRGPFTKAVARLARVAVPMGVRR
jgi:MinD-like ATPase involved in chromosome partitioning or flagellar assembly